MTARNYAGVQLSTSSDGYLTDFSHWNQQVGTEIASEEEIIMTDRHWDVVGFIQNQFKSEVPLTIRKIGKSGVVGIKEFYSLFPGGPLKKASRIAGIPKPVSCI